MTLGDDGRLQRDGLELEMNPYCRRAVGKGTELVAARGGSLTVISLGPPAAGNSVREGVAWALAHGVDARGVLVSDPAFAGSDTLATARALEAALGRLGRFDLVLCGRNSVDADTGQVGPELAELVGLPFAGPVRQLDVSSDGMSADVECELDDGSMDATLALPAVLSCAERLCDPCKVPPEGRAAVPDDRMTVLTAPECGPGPWGQGCSPTSVGEVRTIDVQRLHRMLEGSVGEQVARCAALLAERGALDAASPDSPGSVPVPTARLGGLVGVLVEPRRERLTRELLGAAATLATGIDGRVVAVGPDVDAAPLGPQGADDVLSIVGSDAEEDVAAAVSGWAMERSPWGVLAPSTVWGREVASRVAARLGAGLTGDAVELELDEGRLLAWKPAFGGAMVAAIRASSPTQMVTVRAGMLPVLDERDVVATLTKLEAESRGRVVVHRRRRDDDVDALANAEVVIGVGQGVDPTEYHLLETLRAALGAELGATRKVTDKGWMPRARQIGITGRSIRSRLFISVGSSGKFNHTVGVRACGTVVAINPDPDAPVFDAADIGIVADWHDVVPSLAEALSSPRR